MKRVWCINDWFVQFGPEQTGSLNDYRQPAEKGPLYSPLPFELNIFTVRFRHTSTRLLLPVYSRLQCAARSIQCPHRSHCRRPRPHMAGQSTCSSDLKHKIGPISIDLFRRMTITKLLTIMTSTNKLFQSDGVAVPKNQNYASQKLEGNSPSSFRAREVVSYFIICCSECISSSSSVVTLRASISSQERIVSWSSLTRSDVTNRFQTTLTRPACSGWSSPHEQPCLSLTGLYAMPVVRRYFYVNNQSAVNNN